MARRPLVFVAGFLPFALLAITLGAFLRTRDPLAFAYGGLAACVYLLAFVLYARRMRRGRRGAKAKRAR